MIYRTHVWCVYQCNVQRLVSDIIMNIQTVSRPLLTRPADGHWHSYELRHCCCQWFGDLVAMERRSIYKQAFVWGGISRGREFDWRKYDPGMSGVQDITEK